MSVHVHGAIDKGSITHHEDVGAGGRLGTALERRATDAPEAVLNRKQRPRLADGFHLHNHRGRPKQQQDDRRGATAKHDGHAAPGVNLWVCEVVVWRSEATNRSHRVGFGCRVV